MTKTLLLVRHAKSSWDTAAISDFDRPLNERGKRDAPEMARRLQKKAKHIDLFVSSPAKRAKKTAELFVREYGKNEKKIIIVPALYHATTRDFLECIHELDDRFDTVVIFSHNPGITEFAGTLTDVTIDNMPTCSIIGIEVATKSWAKFDQAKKSFLFFDYPKSETTG